MGVVVGVGRSKVVKRERGRGGVMGSLPHYRECVGGFRRRSWGSTVRYSADCWVGWAVKVWRGRGRNDLTATSKTPSPSFYEESFLSAAFGSCQIESHNSPQTTKQRGDRRREERSFLFLLPSSRKKDGFGFLRRLKFIVSTCISIWW